MQVQAQTKTNAAMAGKGVPGSKAKAAAFQWRPTGGGRNARERANEIDNASLVLHQAGERHKDDVWGQFAFLMREYRIPAAKGRARSVGSATTERYGETYSAFLHTLGGLNMLPKNLAGLTVKHFRRAMEKWEENNLSASSLANRYSMIARLYRWLKKDDNFPELGDTLKDPKRAVRVTSAQSPKSWEENGVDPMEAIEVIGQICPVTAMQLKLARAFGLRTAEAIQIRPFAADARFDPERPRAELHLTKGTKGGLIRDVPIENEEQIALLEEAKRMTNAQTGLLGRYGHNYTAARNHYYYVLGKAGISKKGMGVTAHGLRHGYVNKVFEQLTGEKAPVAGGQHVDHAKEVAARTIISRRIGHARPGITTAYAGSQRNVTVLQRRAMEKLLNTFNGNEAFQATVDSIQAKLGEAGLTLNIYAYGREAEGRAVPPGVPLNLALELEPITAGAQIEAQVYDLNLAEAMRDLQDALNAAARRSCAMVDSRSLKPEEEVLRLVG